MMGVLHGQRTRSARSMPAEPPHPPSPPELPQDGLEIEWQFATDDLAPVRAWLGAGTAPAGLVIEPLPSQSLRDTYLDTADWRLFRAGFALRVRRVGSHAEATLKSLRSARADRAERHEITELLPDAGTPAPQRAPGPVGAWLRAASGSEALRTLFTVQTHRERFSVHQDASDPIGDLALDETRLLGAGEQPLGRLLRVEVEVRRGAPEALLPLVYALSRACHLQPARENKFAAGLRAAALSPPLDPRTR